MPARIIICDHETLSAEDLEKSLRELGYEIAGRVSSGAEAVRLVEESRPDLILMDIGLNGELDGIEIAIQIRSRFDIPLVYLTARIEADVLERAKRTQPYGYLTRSMDRLELRNVIETALCRHEAERRVRVSEERYRSLVDQSLDVIWQMDLHLRFTYVSKAVLAATGYSPEEWLGTPLSDYCDEENFRIIYQAASGETAKRDKASGFTVEAVIQKKDRQSLPVEIHGQVRFDDCGAPLGLQGIARDIAERKRKDQLLQENERNYRFLFEGSPDGMLVAQGSRLLYTNSALREMLGYGKSELEGLDHLAIYHPDYCQATRSRVQALMTREPVVKRYETKLLRKDGASLDCEVIAGLLHVGGQAAAQECFRDITERKRKEQERLANLRFLESMDKINKAMQGNNELEQTMSDALDTTLEIFDCDRAWLSYPCDTEADCWTTPMESTKPEYPGAFALGEEQPMTEDVAWHFRKLLASKGPVIFGPESACPVAPVPSTEFGFQSVIGMALRPKVGKPWAFGLRQCSYPRGWAREERLFQEIGRRLEDGLSAMLAHRSLRDNMGRFEETQRIGHIGYCDSDITNDQVTLAEETCRIFGISPQEPVFSLKSWHERWLSLLHPDDRPRADQTYLEALANGLRCDLEYRIVRPSGEIRHIHAVANVTRDDSGHAIRVLCTIQDITSGKMAQERLHQSDERFRSVFENAAVGIGVADSSGKFLQINRSISEMLGYTKDELLSLSGSDITHPDDKEISRIRHNKMVCGETDAYRFEKRYVKKSGEILWVDISVSPVSGPGGGYMETIGVAVDITEQKKAEELLRQAELRYRILFENAPSMYVVTRNEHGRPTIADCNEMFARNLGQRRNEIVGRNLESFCPNQSTCEFVEGDGCSRQAEGHFFLGERQLVRRDGSAIPTLLYTTPQRSPDGQLVGTLAMFVDITEQKAAKEALLKSEAKLSNAMTMAHLGHWEYDATNDLFTFNDHFYRLFRTTADQVGGYSMSWSEYCRRFVHPEDVSVVGARIRNCLASDNLDSNGKVEHRIVYADGEPGYVTMQYFAAKDDSGRATGAYGVIQDITVRREAEKEIAQHRERLELALAGANLYMWDIDLETREISSSTRGWSLLGYPRDTIVIPIDSWIELIHPQDRDWALSHLQEVISGASSLYEAEYRINTLDRGFIWVFKRGAVVERNSEGAAVRIAGTIMDISARKELEEAVRNSYESFTDIVQSSGDGILVVDDQGRLLYANPSAEAMIGRSIDELVGMWLGVPSAKELSEIGLLDTDGGQIMVEMRASRITWRGQRAWMMLLRDITARKRYEEALKGSEERLRTVIEASPIGITIVQDERLQYVNPALLDMLGYESSDALTGQPVEALYQEDERANVSEQDKPFQTQEIRGARFLERRMVKKDGDTVEVNVWIKAILYGGRHSFLGFIVDASKEKTLRAQLLQAQKMEAIGTLAGGVAHDFNNILTVVQGYSEMMLADKSPDHPDYTDLYAINSASRRGAALVKQLMTFSRKIETDLRPVNLNKEVRTSVKLLSRTIPKMIDIQLHLSQDVRPINADPGQIEQVILNLAVNAKHAMPDGGTLTFETGGITLDKGYCRSHPEAKLGEHVYLKIEDTGHGMPKELLQRVFEPFFSTKNPGEGTGLGLAMVYGIVKSHGGHITCFSEPGVGTSFSIYLPAIEDTASSGEFETFEEWPGGAETILLVDDEGMIRGLGRKMLEQAGYTVLEARTGEEAVETYRDRGREIDLVMLDLIMPGMGGRQALAELRNMDADVRVIVSSGYSPDQQLKAKIDGADGFVAKPFKRSEALRTLREVLDR